MLKSLRINIAGPLNQNLKLASRPDSERPCCTLRTLEMLRNRRQNSPSTADASSLDVEDFVLPLSPISVISLEGKLAPAFVLTRVSPLLGSYRSHFRFHAQQSSASLMVLLAIISV